MQDLSLVQTEDGIVTPEKKKKKKRKKAEDEEGTQASSETTADSVTEGTSIENTEVIKVKFLKLNVLIKYFLGEKRKEEKEKRQVKRSWGGGSLIVEI